MASRTALVLRHVRFEGLAGFAAPIAASGYAVAECDVPEAATMPDLLAPDLVVVMGGPMGVYEAEAHPWLRDEVAGLLARLEAERPTLGVCLGSQLIASALGARVYAGPTKEVGFAPVDLSTAGEASPLRHLAGVPLLHWHGDTFDLPEGVTLLASTPPYRHQAFARDAWLLALQCHPEMGTDAGFGRWLDGADDYLAAAGTDATTLGEAYPRLGPAAVRAGQAMLADWLEALPR